MAVANDGRSGLCGSLKTIVCVALAFAVSMLASKALIAPAHAIEEAQAAKGPPFKVAVFYSSRTDVCYDPGDVAAIKKLTLDERERLNARGGVSGRPIELQFFDDARDDGAIANVRTALSDPQMLAMVGLSNSSRGKAVFDALGSDILKSGVPFLSNQSVNSLFAAYPNVYTTRASQDTDSVPVIARFTKQLNFSRPAFVGLRDSVALAALGDGLKSALGDGGLVSDVRIGAKDDKPVDADLAAALADVGEKRPDLLYLYIGGANVPQFMKELVAMVRRRSFAGRIDSLPLDTLSKCSIAWRIACRKLIRPPRTLVTRARRGRGCSFRTGWAKAVQAAISRGNPFTSANSGRSCGSQYADMVKLGDAALTAADIVRRYSNRRPPRGRPWHIQRVVR
jgi:hypothetical protein